MSGLMVGAVCDHPARSQTAPTAGFTTLEMAVVIMVIAVLVSGFSTLLYSTVFEARKTSAYNQLNEIKKAIVGEARTVPPGEKSVVRHGYVGDIGNLPSSLTQLETPSTEPDYSRDAILQAGAGWRGPYISPNASKSFADPWGNAVVYTVAAGTSSVTGAATVATLRSNGPDGIADTPDDHLVEIYKAEALTRVTGFVKDAFGQTLPGITVKLVYPANGAIPGSPAATQSDNEGLYTFTDVPQGLRVLQLEPKLSYQRGTGYTTGNDRNNVELYVENLGKPATNVSSVKITYTSNPVSDFQQVLINGSAIASSSGTSGKTVTFTATTVNGTGVIQEPFRVDVAGLVMTVPDAVVGTVGTGGTLKIQINDFEEVGTNNNVDMTGVTFTLEFSDGSKTLFAPVRK